MAIPLASSASAAFERRSARADLLARRAGDPEPLRFAAGLLRAQAGIAAALEDEHASRPLTGSLDEDLERILGRLRDVPRFAARAGPAPLARAARSRAVEDEDVARTRLQVFWKGGRTSAEDYLSRAMLRPYLELLCIESRAPDRPRVRGRCPFCSGAPVIGLLRGGGEGTGAPRFLACALCGLEWATLRILCSSCGERDPAKLPSFSSESHPAVRIDACETCRRYVKTLDLSRDARLVPEVDDLMSLSLDLWAGERGFTRLEPGLAGV